MTYTGAAHDPLALLAPPSSVRIRTWEGRMKAHWHCVVAAWALALSTAPIAAADYPNKSVQIIAEFIGWQHA